MKTIHVSRLSTFAMAAGGEKRVSAVIDNGELKEWVGIGWVTVREATEEDRKKFPTVRRRQMDCLKVCLVRGGRADPSEALCDTCGCFVMIPGVAGSRLASLQNIGWSISEDGKHFVCERCVTVGERKKGDAR